MSEFLARFQSMESWEGVTFLTIMVTLITTYALRWIDNCLLTFSGWWREKRKSADSNYKSDLESLFADPQKEKIFTNSETRSRLQAIQSSLQAFAMFFLAFFFDFLGSPGWVTSPAFLLGGFFWVFYIYHTNYAHRTQRLLNDFYNSTRDSATE